MGSVRLLLLLLLLRLLRIRPRLAACRWRLHHLLLLLLLLLLLHVIAAVLLAGGLLSLRLGPSRSGRRGCLGSFQARRGHLAGQDGAAVQVVQAAQVLVPRCALLRPVEGLVTGEVHNLGDHAAHCSQQQQQQQQGSQ